MSKVIKYGEDANTSIISGIDKVANIVKTTVGPKGRNVLIRNQISPPIITNDGVTIAKSIELKDNVEDAGAQLIISSARKTNDVAGDGPQPLSAKVLTPDGFVEIKSLNIGDNICGTNNTIQKVVGTYRKGIKHQYKVVLSDGSSVLCSGDHLWSVYSYYKHTPELETITVNEMLNRGLYRVKNKGKQAMFYIPVTSVEFNDIDTPIDPFLLGVLLGDGSVTNKYDVDFSIGYKKISKIIDNIKLRDGWYLSKYEYPNKNCVRFRIKGRDKNGKTVGDYLEELNLIGTRSGTKFIPKSYIYNTTFKRKQLLEGLLVTDGHINKRGLFEFSTVSDRLCEDFIELIKSLGIQYNYHRYTDRVNSYGSNPINVITQLKGYKYGNKIVNIIDTNEDVEMMCIKVSNFDELYITDNYVVTHNTTTTTILAQEMIHKFYEYVEDDKDINVVQVQKEMIKASNEISDYLKSISIPVEDIASIERVATISSGSNEVGKMIASAFEQAGEYGSVIVEDSKTGMDNLVSIQGMKLTNGSVTPYLLKDRVNRKSDVMDVNILITKDKIDSVPDMFGVLDVCIQEGRKLLIICDDIEFEPLNMILVNKAKGIPVDVSIIRLPAFGDLREQLIEDICIATGATLMGRDVGRTLKNFTPEFLGEVEQVTVTMDDTIIKFKDMSTNGNNLLEARESRVAEINSLLENAKEDDVEQYKRRISNLISGISVIEVGGNSEVEVKDKKLRIEDAINSVQAAKEEGIVAGGGYSFLSAIINAPKKEGSLGEEIVYNSLEAVTRQIAENAGYDGTMTVTECFNKKLGFNALTGEFEDLVETGVINSVKVDRYSLLNATSLASTVVTMGGAICEENEKDQNVLQLQGPISLPPV